MKFYRDKFVAPLRLQHLSMLSPNVQGRAVLEKYLANVRLRELHLAETLQIYFILAVGFCFLRNHQRKKVKVTLLFIVKVPRVFILF